MKLPVTLQTLLNHEQLRKDLSVAHLVEEALIRKEGNLTNTGALHVTTGKYTGRSPKDRFIVSDSTSNDHVDWNDVTNQKISENSFSILYKQMIDYLSEKSELFSFSGYAGADETYQLPVQVITELAWHNLFSRQMLIPARNDAHSEYAPSFTILSAPNFKANSEVAGLNSESFVIISLAEKVVLIGGTQYAGEIKKAIFSIMNFLLPDKNVLPMHCSANIGEDDDVTLFFGLSGTGKTTLSAAPSRSLIGDDEHGWSNNGIFNIEGGCYAKCSHLSRDKEPEIFDSIRFGAILENVAIDPKTHVPNYDDLTLTENSRAAYPLSNMKHILSPSIAGHPSVVLFLTADASGTLPPISKLSKEQAMYHFLSGYTSKLAGTEQGITEPEATFSACFGAPFLPLSPTVYARMLGEKINTFNSSVYLINTGWTGGPYGVGKRIDLAHTRAMVRATMTGELNKIKTKKDSIFGLDSPYAIPGVPSDILFPEDAWNDKDAYFAEARKLAKKFHRNFEQFSEVSKSIKQAGPIQ